MKHSEQAKQLILKTRPFYSEKTKLWNNHLYIGYFHLIQVRDSIPDIKFTKKDAVKLLDKDLTLISKQLTRHIEIQLNQNQFDALVSLVYDIGIKTFISDEIFELLNKNKIIEVSAKIRKFNKYMKKPIYQLVKTRKLEIELFNSEIKDIK